LAIIFYLFYGVHVSIVKLYDSVHDAAGGIKYPPKANAAVFVPAPAKAFLATIIAPPADHEVPLNDSVHDLFGEYPPNANADKFEVPAPAS
jgi:hypothetical protein